MSALETALRAEAVGLLAEGRVQVVIGHEPGTGGRRRPLFARTAVEADRLVLAA